MNGWINGRGPPGTAATMRPNIPTEGVGVTFSLRRGRPLDFRRPDGPTRPLLDDKTCVLTINRTLSPNQSTVFFFYAGT